MKQYILQEDYRGYTAQSIFYGPYPVTGGGNGYFTKENIPGPEGGTNCLFSSFVESSTLFKEISNAPLV